MFVSVCLCVCGVWLKKCLWSMIQRCPDITVVKHRICVYIQQCHVYACVYNIMTGGRDVGVHNYMHIYM